MTDAPILGRLLVLSTTGQTAQPYTAAAEKLAVACVIATDITAAEGPAAEVQPPALRLRFAVRESALEIVQYAMEHPLAAIIAADERCAPTCARAATMIGMRSYAPKAADACLDKFALRQKLGSAGLRTPALGDAPPGRDLAMAAIIDSGKMRVLGVVEDGSPTVDIPKGALEAVYRAARVVLLTHGPLHAQVRVAGEQVWLLDLTPVIPMRMGDALRFKIPLVDEDVSLAEVIVRHALGIDISRVHRK